MADCQFSQNSVIQPVDLQEIKIALKTQLILVITFVERLADPLWA